MTGAALAGTALAAVLVAGCVDRVELLPCPPSADGGTPATCTRTSPPVRFHTLAGDDRCAGAVAARVLRQALCSCDSLALTAALSTDAIDSRGHAAPEGLGAAVATDGDVLMSAALTVGGPLTAGGAGGVRLARAATVARTLRSAGPVTTAEALQVGGDAYVGGDVTGPLAVAGTLHVASGSVVAPAVVARSVARDAAALASPCGCAEGPVVSPQELVAARVHKNDDAVAGLSPDELAGEGDAHDLDLPAGQYYLTRIRSGSDRPMRWHLRGRVALFVGGDVRLGGALHVDLAPDAELDLVVAGDFTFAGGTLGALDAAARVRLWLGSSLVQLSDGTHLGALVYAPGALLSALSELSVTGALFVRSLAASGPVAVHYDLATLAGGAPCGLSPEAPLD